MYCIIRYQSTSVSISFSGDQVILKLRGRDLTLDYLEKNGFNKPLKIEKKDGLGLVVPDSSFSIIDVERHVGEGLSSNGSTCSYNNWCTCDTV